MKKVLSFILVLSMVLGSFGLTFAAPTASFADVEDASVGKAVERLKAFGVVDGYEDGSYKPENMVTREEFAKLLVAALGMEHAAKAVTVSNFKDIEAGRWSAGYVAVAAGQGLIIGDQHGNFRPADKVTYAEAVTMLVRAVGYQDSFLKGTWPGNFVAKAAELSITSKVKFADAVGFANRGEVAILVNNTLDADVVKVETYEGAVIKYKETDIPLLEDKLNIEKLKNIRLVANSRIESGLKNHEVEVITTKKDVEYDGKKYDKNERIVFDITKDFKSEKFIGKEITAYLNDDDEIVYAEVETTTGNVYELDRLDYSYNDGYEEQIVTIKGNGKKVDVYSKDGKRNQDKDVDDFQFIYLDGERVDNNIKSLEDSLGEDVFGTFVIDNNKLVYADLIRWDNMNYVVESVDATKERIVYIDTDKGTDDKKLDLATKYEAYSIFLSDGTKIELKDLKENDVFNLAESKDNDDDVAIIYVWRNSVDGKFGKISGGTGATEGKNDGKRITVEIGAKSYSLENKITYTVDSGDDYDVAEGRTVDGREELEDFDGETVLALRNWKDRIVFITGDAKATSKEQYGIVMKYGSGIREEIKIYTSKDEEVVYKLEETKDYDYLVEKAPVGSVLKYKLNKDGEIAELERNNKNEVVGQYTFALSKDIATIKKGDDFGKTSVRIDGKTFYVKDNTAFFDMTEAVKGTKEAGFTVKDINDVDIFAWDDIEDKDVTRDIYVLYAEATKDRNKGDLDFLAIVEGLDSIKDDVAGAYFVDSYRKGDTNYADVAVYDGGTKTYELEKQIERYHLKGRVFPIETTSNNKIRIANDKDYKTVAGKITDTDKSRLRINGAAYGIKKNAVIYSGNKAIDLNSITEDDFVVAILNKGEIEALSLVYSATSSERLGKGVIVKDGKLEIQEGNKVVTYISDIVEMITNDGYLSNTTYKPTNLLKAGNEVEFIYNRDTKEILALWVKGEGSAVDPVDPVAKGVVTYINTGGTSFEADGVIYNITAATVLKYNGATVSVGLEAGSMIKVGDKVKVEGNVITVTESATLAAVVAKKAALEKAAARFAQTDVKFTSGAIAVTNSTTLATAKNAVATVTAPVLTAAEYAFLDGTTVPTKTAYDTAESNLATTKTNIATYEGSATVTELDTLIANLPVNTDPAFANKVAEAKTKYDALTGAQKDQLTNEQDLLDAIAMVEAMDKVAVAKAAFSGLTLNDADRAISTILKPAKHANGATYDIAVSNIVGATDGTATGTDPITTTRDTIAQFTFDVTVTITSQVSGQTATDSTLVFTVTVPVTGNVTIAVK